MSIDELIATIFASLFLLASFIFCFWWLFQYGIKEAKETKELRKLWKKWLEQHTKEDK